MTTSRRLGTYSPALSLVAMLLLYLVGCAEKGSPAPAGGSADAPAGDAPSAIVPAAPAAPAVTDERPGAVPPAPFDPLRTPALSLSKVPAAGPAGRGKPGASAEGWAREILSATEFKGGLVVHLGSGDGRLTAALYVAAAGKGCLVHGLDRDAAKVEMAREHIRRLGLYGKVTVERLNGDVLPYIDDLANLVVVEDPGDVSMDEVTRVLCPGGFACVREDGAWTATVKPGPKETDEWTHWRHGADGNMVSRDALVGPPRRVQWAAGPLWQRHHGTAPSITTMVSAGGRVFYIIDEAPAGASGMPGKWSLVARDAYNGVLLWKRPIAEWGSEAWSYWTEGHAARFNHPLHVRKRLVAAGDRVYVTLGFNAPVSSLDAGTGKTVTTYEGTDYTDEIVFLNGVLFLSVNDRPQRPWPGEGILPAPTSTDEESTKRIWAVRAGTGEALWKSGPFTGKRAKPDRLGSMKHLSLIAGEKGVFLVDDREVVCLDLATGERRWAVPRLSLPSAPEKRVELGKLYHNMNRVDMQALVYYRGVLLVFHSKGHSGYKWESASLLQALDAGTGEEMWRHAASPVNYLDVPDVFGIGGLVWVPDGKARALVALDLRTGEEKRTIPIAKALDVPHHHRCYPNKATERYVILARRGAEFVDLETGEIAFHHWARSGCRYGHLLANGLVYRLPDYCRCYTSMQPRGFLAMAPGDAPGDAAGDAGDGGDGGHLPGGDDPLEKGPAYDEVRAASPRPAPPGEWPTFRHDPERSGSATCVVPAELEVLWRAGPGGRLTAPVAAGGKVLVASPDRHEVYALSEESGETLWSFTAGGRVDSPPTVHEGTAIFGAADGRVYCLRLSDGRLAWRFRAAPVERRIVAFGGVESAWPVRGSVLVAGGTVFLAAGRSSFLDGGVYALALDARTGEPVDQKRIHEVQTETGTTGKLPAGALPDVLSTDGETIYLRNRKLDLSARLPPAGEGRFARIKPHLVAESGFLDEFWFHRVSWRLGKTAGNHIVFDETRAYSAAALEPGKSNQSFYIPAGGRRDRVIGGKGVTGPGWLTDIRVRYGGYILFARGHGSTGRGARSGGARTAWRVDRLHVCPWAMVVAGEVLFVAGFRDRIEPEDPWATFEGRAGGVLLALSAADGRTLAEYELDAPPVWNGMAAATPRTSASSPTAVGSVEPPGGTGRLYVSTRDGRLTCMGKR